MEGYPELASIMGRYFEMGILRRFGTLNALNLLYLQAELIELESELQEIAGKDVKSDIPFRSDFAHDWVLLSKPIGNGDEKQWQKVLQIRAKLKEYNQCVFQQVNLSKLDCPDENSLKELRKFLEERRPLVGLDRGAWDYINQHDLIAIRPQQPGDCVSRWVLRALIPLYHELVGKHFKKPVNEAPLSRICYYSGRHLLTVIDVLGIAGSSLLPISSIVALYFVSSTLRRLGIVAGFTAGFSACLKILTEARRIEIFAAIAAFAAVQVVFIGTNNVVAS